MRYGEHEIDDDYVQSRLLPRIFRRLRRKGECLVWMGGTAKGYSHVTVKTTAGKRVHASAHRIMAILFFGDLGELEVDHTCRNRRCVRWAHLEPCTGRENCRRMISRLHDDRHRNQLKLPWE
jgi:hypothetical protein